MSEVLQQAPGVTVAFGDVVQLSKERSKDPASDGFERYVGLEHLEPSDLKVRSWGDVNDGTTFTNVFRPGQVLFGKRRAYQRKVAIADFSGVCSSDIYVLEPKGDHLLPELLPFVCQSEDFYDYVISMSQGGLSPRVNWKALAKYEFALPPLDEQRRISTLMSSYDEAVDRLVEARAALLSVKQSVLTTVFRDAASGVQLASLSELLTSGLLDFQTGPFGTVLAAREYTDSGWPIVNPTDIRDGVIAHSGGPCVDDPTAARVARYRMRPGDVLLARKGEIDKACIAEESHNGWIVGSDCIRLRAKASVVLPRYLLYFLQAPQTGRALASFAHGTVMPGINEKMLRRLALPLSGLVTQTKVVDRLAAIDSSMRPLFDRELALGDLRRASLSSLLIQSGDDV